MGEKRGLKGLLYGFILVLLIFVSYFVIAENPAIVVWNFTLNDGGISYAIAIDNNSNIYITGESNMDIYLKKFNSSGTNLWNASINGLQNSWDRGRGVSTDSSGNIYVAGETLWGAGAMVPDIYIGKWNSSGTNLWNATINGNKNYSDVGHAAAVDNNSNVYVVGEINNSGTRDIYLGKFSSTGVNLWNATINGLQNKDDIGRGVAVDYEGNIYVTGQSYWEEALNISLYLGKFNSTGTNLWNATIVGHQGFGVVTYNDSNNVTSIYVVGTTFIFLTKFNSTGSNIWNATITNLPTDREAYGRGVSVDSSGSIYPAGHFFDSSDNDYDIYLGKFNPSGSNLWNTTVGGSLSFRGYGVAVEPSLGDIYVSGYETSQGTYLGKFSVDTINPTAAFSCSPLFVMKGETITCGCTPSDVFSGINSSLTFYTANPDTSQTGSFTTTCSFADIVGNTGSASVIYNVNQPAAKSQPSTTTPIETISAGESTTVEIANPNIEITSITITTTESVSGGSIKVTEVKNVKRGDLEIGVETGDIYRAFDITLTNISDSQIANASVNFRVNRTWIEKGLITFLDVLMFRKNDLTGVWDVLVTNFVSEDSNFYYYSALTPGFSTFVIFTGKYDCIPSTRRCFESQTQLCLGNATWLVTERCPYGCDEQGTCLETPLQSNTFYISLIVIVGVVAVVIVYLLATKVLKKKRRKERR